MDAVPRKTLGGSELQITTIGLGTWAIGGGDWMFGWGHQDEQEAVNAILHAVELGINWVDTAAVYGAGRSEELVGTALSRMPPEERPLVATKCGRIVQPDGTVRGQIKRDSVLSECDASLKRLGIEAIDLYQLHWPNPDEDIEEAWQAMSDLVAAGKARTIGVSNHSVQQMDRLQPIHPIASLQPPYNLLARNVEQETLSYCADEGIGVVCYSPLAKGLLTGKFSPGYVAGLPENDHRRRDPNFQQPRLGAHLQLVDELAGIAAQAGRSPAELAIAWVLRRPEVTAAIVGARRPEQIEALATAGSWQLAADTLQAVEAALRSHTAALSQIDSPA